ncbi:MAG: hypothetical protein IIB33_06860, partial [Chloroflexi bacterium]|nr:hypothetical protein [Chloroflexota bacterium]
MKTKLAVGVLTMIAAVTAVVIGLQISSLDQSAQAQVIPVAEIEPTAKELEVANIEIKPAPDVTPRISRDAAIEVGLRIHFDSGGILRTHTGVGATFGLVT